MKQLKYWLTIFLPILLYALPIGMLIAWLNFNQIWMLVVTVLLAGAAFALQKPLESMRIEARQDVEYDEFGRSKSKGDYSRLSKAERDQIDLQKTADMERVMNSSAIKKITKEGSVNPQQDMDKLIGLVPVKEKMREMVARMQFENEDRVLKGKQKKKEKGKDEIGSSMSGRHMIFYGSPGTGKTTVARILTGFLYQYGYIKKNKCVEVDGNFLKAGADTALKTELVIRQAYDGVLFVDEAYSLMEGDRSGKEAIATLIKQMEDNRDRFILILAGYTNEMKNLLNLNPGFESRIKEYLDFPDYDDQEMKDIFVSMARDSGFTVSDEALDAFGERVKKERRLRSFGNARTARNILDESIDRYSLNFVSGKLQKSDRYCLCGIDISKELKRSGFN